MVELDTLIPVPRAAPHVAGLSALRSRVLTVIDCQALARARRQPIARTAFARRVVVELDGHHYALLVDQVEDVVEALSEPTPVRGAMEAGLGAGRLRHGRNRDRADARWSMSRRLCRGADQSRAAA